MKTSQCLFNSAIALRNVFISNAATLETPGQLQRLLLPAIAVPLAPSPRSSQLQRPFSTLPAAQYRYSRKPSPDAARNSANASSPRDRIVRDGNITFQWIQLRGEDGKLGEPVRTATVLQQINRERQSLIVVAPPRADKFSKGPELAICRVVDRAERAALPEKDAAKNKAGKIVTKEQELNWAIAPHDLRTKMTQLKKFLSKGYQVRVMMLAPKKRNKRKATMDECKAMLQAVLDTIAEVPGAKEIKARDGNLGGTLTMILHAPKSAEPASAPPATPQTPETPETPQAPVAPVAAGDETSG